MVGEALRAVLLAAEGAGLLEGGGVATGRADHPVCGDEVVLSVRLDGDRIAALRWQARACPAATAVAALAAKVLPGVQVVAAPATLRAAIGAHGGLAAHERHAEALLLRALAAAVAAHGGTERP
jgi:NifU-like protein involved in Fe-S cluster formation